MQYVIMQNDVQNMGFNLLIKSAFYQGVNNNSHKSLLIAIVI